LAVEGIGDKVAVMVAGIDVVVVVIMDADVVVITPDIVVITADAVVITIDGEGADKTGGSVSIKSCKYCIL